MTNKMTNRNALSFVLENCEVPADVRERLESMRVALEKKAQNPAVRKPSKEKVANDGLRDRILEMFMAEPDRVFTCAEIGKALDSEGMNPQRVSGLMKPLIEEGGAVVKTTVKGRANYQLRRG